jgi:hypothetical protein
MRICGSITDANMNGYEVFCTYQAIKLHFTTDTYCFFKYNGHVATKPEGFEKRKDKYMFHKLARQLKDNEVVGFFVAGFLLNDKAWVDYFIEPEAKERYLAWRKKKESLSYLFDQDMSKIVEEFDKRDLGIASMFKIPNGGNGNYPLIWTMMNQHEIEFETMVILHGITGVLDLWDTKYMTNYIYEKTSRLIRKYEPFLELDVPKLKEIVRKHLTAA